VRPLTHEQSLRPYPAHVNAGADDGAIRRDYPIYLSWVGYAPAYRPETSPKQRAASKEGGICEFI
jgi:hypothetical protein